tara:strand:- start:14606 stop:14707 length:102 start_codon:yes stop_codon:yes gene_type:complete
MLYEKIIQANIVFAFKIDNYKERIKSNKRGFNE